MSYVLLEEPLSRKEWERARDGYWSGNSTVSLQDVIDNDLEGFLDIVEDRLIGDEGILSDTEYDVIGNGMNDELHIRVSGFVEVIE